MENLATPLRAPGHFDGELRSNARGDAIVGPGLGIVRELTVADIDLTIDGGDPTKKLGYANAIEVAAGTGTLVVKLADGSAVTLGALAALPLGWTCDGLCLANIVASGSTVTVVRVRW